MAAAGADALHSAGGPAQISFGCIRRISLKDKLGSFRQRGPRGSSHLASQSDGGFCETNPIFAPPPFPVDQLTP
jgi:hypothetical protein